MLPFTQELLKKVDAAAIGYGTTFESRLRHELREVCAAQGLGAEREQEAAELLAIFPNLRSENFEVSCEATATVMQLLYALQEVTPRQLVDSSKDKLSNTGALNLLYFQAKPAPTSVVVNDWLSDVIWDKPGSLITYSEDEGRFHLIRPNSFCRLSIQTQFLGSYHAVTDIWYQFQRIKETVSLAERLYREGKQPLTRGARMEAFKNW
jgi:hypothetical protein